MISATPRKKTERISGTNQLSGHARRRASFEPIEPRLGRSPRKKRILLAEDDMDMRELLTWSLVDAGYEVDPAPDGTQLCNRLAKHLLHPTEERIDLVISDIRMPGYGGLDVISGLRNLEELPPTILITAFGDEEIHRRAEDIGVLLLDKPFEIDELLDKVRKSLQ